MQLTPMPKAADWKGKTAYILSGLLSPFLLIPIFIVIVLAAYSANTHQFIVFASISFLFSTLFPFIFIFSRVRKGKITDIHVAVREERKMPFLICMAGILTATLLLYYFEAPREVFLLGLVMFLNGVLFFVITLYWKISMHSSILAAVITSLVILINPLFAIGYALIPVLIWARIQRQRHNIYQGICATLLAIITTYLLFYSFGVTVKIF